MKFMRRLSAWRRGWLVIAICGLIYAFWSPVLSCVEARPGECGGYELEELGVSLFVWLLCVVFLYALGSAGAWFARGRVTLLYGVGVVAAVWMTACAIESVTRLMVGGTAHAGTALPALSRVIIGVVQYYVTWIVAVASTLIIAYLWRRSNEYFLHACTMVAAVAVAILVATCGFIYELGVRYIQEAYELAVRYHREVGPLPEFHILEDVGVTLLSWLAFLVLLLSVAAVAAWIKRGRAVLPYAVSAVAAVWFAAVAIEFVTTLMREVYASFGADLPGPALLTMYSTQIHVPKIIAVVSTFAIGFLWVKASRYVLNASAAVTVLTVLWAAFAMFSLALPISRCGVFWPEWPESLARSPDLAFNADAPRHAPAGECR